MVQIRQVCPDIEQFDEHGGRVILSPLLHRPMEMPKPSEDAVESDARRRPAKRYAPVALWDINYKMSWYVIVSTRGDIRLAKLQ